MMKELNNQRNLGSDSAYHLHCVATARHKFHHVSVRVSPKLVNMQTERQPEECQKLQFLTWPPEAGKDINLSPQTPRSAQKIKHPGAQISFSLYKLTVSVEYL